MLTVIHIPSYAAEIIHELERMGFSAYVVGGCVRDSLLGQKPADWDICTDARPEQMLQVFRKWRVFETGLKHGTITVRSRGHNVEVTTFRTDGTYSDNRHPDAVRFVSRIPDDLARRDFTINAMAYNDREGLVDTFGGQKDLEEQTLRCVGEPDVRFHEDALRILRALRFAARFQFAIETETAYSIRRNRLLLENISAERIFKELQGILTAPGAGDMLTAFPEVFSAILPELAGLVGSLDASGINSWTFTAHAVQTAPAENFPNRLAMLLHQLTPQAVTSALARLKSDNATARFVTTLLEHLAAPLPTSRPEMRRLIGSTSREMAEHIIHAHGIVNKLRHGSYEEIRSASTLLAEVLDSPPAYNVRHLAIGGNDLMKDGLAQGRLVGQILEQLLREVQDETLPNTKQSLLTRATELTQNCTEPQESPRQTH